MEITILKQICGDDFSRKFPSTMEFQSKEEHCIADITRRFMFIFVACKGYGENEAWEVTQELIEEINQVYYS
jgi:hypothetical protein